MKTVLFSGSDEAASQLRQVVESQGFPLICEEHPPALVERIRRSRVVAVVLPPYPDAEAQLPLLQRLGKECPQVAVIGLCDDGQAAWPAAAEGLFGELPANLASATVGRLLRRAEEWARGEAVQTLLHQRLAGLEYEFMRAGFMRQALARPLAKADRLPIPGLAIGAMEHPCHGCGGDLTGWFVLPDDRVVAYVADAAGHDLAATVIRDFIACELQVLYARGRFDLLGKPAQLFRHLNALLYPARRAYASMAYLVINPRNHQVEYASAGHPPLICRTADARTDLYFSDGAPLGMEEDPVFPLREFFLDHYTHISAFSDGLVDGRTTRLRTGTQVGFDMESLKEFHLFAPEDPQEFAQMIYRRHRQLCGETVPADDVSVLVIRTGIAYSQRNLTEPLPPAPPSRYADAENLLGLVGTIGAEAGCDPAQGIYFVIIRDRADFRLASVLVPEIKRKIAEGIRRVVLDCLEISGLDSCFMGDLLEISKLCDACGCDLRISLGRREFIDNIKEFYLNDVLRHTSPTRWQWDGPLAPICRRELGEVPEDATHLRDAHRALADHHVENRRRLNPLLDLLNGELDGDS